MVTTQTIDYWWRTWVDLFQGLPWDKHMMAYAALALVFWAIGFAFKSLTQK
ncbi:MAG: hypothetical protein KBA31_09310 [Alphaproteobacteria bacterium]|nr:hypothetical protein [Alphaproteobacteria bacterium]